jgi:hypothetical protein
MKTHLKYITEFFLTVFCVYSVIILSCSGSGGGTGGGQDTGGGSTDNRIQNTIVENTTPFGLSTFALGVPGKFPLEDSQTPEGIGYKSVAKVVRHIATNELYTFPETPSHPQVQGVLESFINEGFLVTHEIHILNGPSMRKSRDPWINGVVGRNVSDSEFVSMLQSNQKVRDAVQNLFGEVVAYANTLEAVGINVLICPELEDNENHNTFNILLSMLANVGWTDKSKIVRNGGIPGENGTRYESHTISNVGILRPGDIFNNDGNTFCFNTKPNCAPGALTESQIRSAIQNTQARGAIMFVWSAHLQGNQQTSPGNFIPYPEYANRHYVFDGPIESASLLLGVSESEVIVK